MGASPRIVGAPPKRTHGPHLPSTRHGEIPRHDTKKTFGVPRSFWPASGRGPDRELPEGILGALGSAQPGLRAGTHGAGTMDPSLSSISPGSLRSERSWGIAPALPGEDGSRGSLSSASLHRVCFSPLPANVERGWSPESAQELMVRCRTSGLRAVADPNPIYELFSNYEVCSDSRCGRGWDT